MNEDELVFDEITNEISRTYIFAGGERLRIERVVRLCVRPSGGHRLETADDHKFIISPNWLAIDILAERWSR